MTKTIQVYEHKRLYVGDVFKERHLKAMSGYITANPKTEFYKILNKCVQFTQYVGVFQVDDLTIEVLPKSDKHDLDKASWRDVLIKMLTISLHIEAKTTTQASISMKRLSVLDAYLLLFLNEVQILLHRGLVKKYRKVEGNKTALKGKLLFDQHIIKNIVHAERFYVAYTTYDSNNLYNSILYKALKTISSLSVSDTVRSKCNTILFDFPECNDVKAIPQLFERISYDRKTNSYKKAIELAKIILLNYHPDFKGGSNNILAIMIDMNDLWESYIFYVLRKAVRKKGFISVKEQSQKSFWKEANSRRARQIIPDIVIKAKSDSRRTFVLDTKWKYDNKVSIEDIRQMYAYGHYFYAKQSYLIYPQKIDNVKKVDSKNGSFLEPEGIAIEDQECGLLYVDPITDKNKLDSTIGEQILFELGFKEGDI